MVSSNIQIIKKNGEKEFVVLPYKDYLALQEKLDDYEDLRVLRAAKKIGKNAPTITLESLKSSLKRKSG